MSITYTPTTPFSSKDDLPANDPNKVIVGSEFTFEFNAIQAAFALAAPTSNPTFTGTATFGTLNAGTTTVGTFTATGTSTLGVLNAGTTTVGTFTSTGIDDNATSTAITITAAEDVGIGTVSPDHTLHIKDSIPILNMEHGAGQSSRIYFEDATDGNWGAIKANYGTAGAEKEIAIAPGNSLGDARFGGLSVKPATVKVGGDFQDTDLIVAGGGQVGIGTDTPESLLTLQGNSPAITVNATDNNTPRLELARDASTNNWRMVNDAAVCKFEVGDDSSSWVPKYEITSGSTHYWNTDEMSLKGGNVGIGTDAPTAPLSIVASDASTTIGGSGSVIKVRNPSGVLSSTSGLEFFHGNVETDVQRLCGIYGQYEQFDATGFGGDLVFATQVAGASSVSERMRIDQDGKVGIGQTSPNSKVDITHAQSEGSYAHLEINGKNTDENTQIALIGSGTGVHKIVANKDLFFGTSANPADTGSAVTNTVTFAANGRVGIGDDAPAEALSVTGSIAATGVMRGTAGTGVGTPTFSFVVDPDTGMYNQAADTLGFATRGLRAMDIESGASTTTTTFYSADATALGGVVVNVGDSGNSPSAAINLATQQATVTLDGAGVFTSDDDTFGGAFTFNTTAPAGSPTLAVKIDSAGNLLVGKSASGFAVAGCRIQPTGDVRISKVGAASDTMVAFYKNGSATAVGSITSTSTATSYNVSSDERLKDNVVDAPAGNLDAVQVRSFDWKANGERQTYGFIAQELEAVAPYAVTKGETEEDMWSVDYSKLVPMLVKEIQDLKAEVEALKNA